MRGFAELLGALTVLDGEPRLTHDVDIVVALASRDIQRFIDAFPLDEFHCPPEDVLAKELTLDGLRVNAAGANAAGANAAGANAAGAARRAACGVAAGRPESLWTSAPTRNLAVDKIVAIGTTAMDADLGYLSVNRGFAEIVQRSR